jgi:hypothetical protein
LGSPPAIWSSAQSARPTRAPSPRSARRSTLLRASMRQNNVYETPRWAIATQPSTTNRQPPKRRPKARATGVTSPLQTLLCPADHGDHAFRTIGTVASSRSRNKRGAIESRCPPVTFIWCPLKFVSASPMPKFRPSLCQKRLASSRVVEIRR